MMRRMLTVGIITIAGTKVWVKRAEAICVAKIRGGFQPMCAPWDCVAPPKPVCRAGACTATY